ncbi:MAG: S41 family peptidase [Chloroflexi bacterium]|nr:S41 family peptidase [Ardenticatenaceae bacterium]MBL1128593.1 S41 family peptidase [Chloroflexota bacterium]NOG34672.1 S41 family peptidase [Chloroflexota bacterium]GIK57734.1 MAG: carboxyl-terminal processing protease [Chloroflexota bacterium]
MSTDSNEKQTNKTLTIVLVVLGVILALGSAGGGYVAGRASVTPETITQTITETVTETIVETITETVTETVEVTRQVEVTREVVTPADSVAADSTESREPTAVPPGNPEDITFDVFYETWQLVEQQYDGDVPPNEDVLYAAIEGSLRTLGDEFTRFIRPDVAERMRQDAVGSVEGIGAFVRENEQGQFEIVRPIPGQPAEKAGLLPGDIIIGVDGQSMEGVSFDEVILLVRGPRGTDVTLLVQREGEDEPLEFTITRVRFEIPTVEYRMLENDIAYIHLQEFNQTAVQKTLAALEELLAQNPQALIFDLRDNPGGFLNQSVAVADLFLPDSVVLFERNRNGLDQTFRADNGDIAETIPLVVLVNPGSASASEIVAGALQDHGRAILIGETTFGKGSVQQVHELSDGSELRVTIARWYTPANNTIDKEGVTPDIEIPMAFGAEEDIQLQRAIEYILNGE